MKYNRYYPDHQTRKVFDDLLGFRSLCNDYDDILQLEKLPSFRVANMSFGKANDDGYRGVHVYYQHSGIHYPIEIQYNIMIGSLTTGFINTHIRKIIRIKWGRH